MQKSQQQAAQSFALKDAYVDGVKGAMKDGRLIPGNIQQPAVLQASGHVFLDEGKVGGINDGDPSMYYHRGGETHKFHDPKYKNPVEGGAGDRGLEDMPEEKLPKLRKQFDDYNNQKHWEKYGTGNMAQFSDPMTIKSVIG